jgi:hypothetical protein
MWRVHLWLAGLIPVLAAAACGAGASSIATVGHPGQTYRDSAGWTIEVPPGWHAVRFSDAKDGITSAGVQLSNVQLPPPTLIPGYPIQVNSQVLPGNGVGLIIATDTDPSLSHDYVAVPPLPAPAGRYWTMGSAPAGAAYMQTLWFRVNDMTFIACVKISPEAASSDRQAITAIIQSLRVAQERLGTEDRVLADVAGRVTGAR